MFLGLHDLNHVFLCFLKCESFGCVDFQLMNKNDERIFQISSFVF